MCCSIVLLKYPCCLSSAVSWLKNGLHCINKLCNTEPVVCHFFTSLDTHDIVGTGESGYLRQNLQIRFCKFFPRIRYDNKHLLFNSILHFSRPPVDASNKDWQVTTRLILSGSYTRHLREVSDMRQNNQQRTVASEIPRSQFLQILSLGKPKGKSLQE
jgi:hypothetical protein